MSIYKPKLITFEGIDNCGKSTQIEQVQAYLMGQGIPSAVVREPGSTTLGGTLRCILKEPRKTYAGLNMVFQTSPDFHRLDFEEERSIEAETLMFMAARAEFYEKVVHPLLVKGTTVLADRSGDSTLAYQGYGTFEGNPAKLQFIRDMNSFVTRRRQPDLTFLLDIPVEIMYSRAEGTDVFESRGKAYFERIRGGYLTIVKNEPDRVKVIEGTKTKAEVFAEIKLYVNALYGF